MTNNNIPNFTIQELIEAGVHFGHKKMRWNPRMAPYIYETRNDVHIINLQKTAPMLYRALELVYEVARKNGRVLFLGTKRKTTHKIAEAAKRCGQYYVNHRWLGGMLTNLDTVSHSIKNLKSLEKTIDQNDEVYQKLTKKEKLEITRKKDKLDKSLGGIAEMGGRPNLLFVIDTNKEKLAVLEAKKLGIPVIAIVDTNCDPEVIDFAVPGNDDATRSIKLYCRLISDTILNGMQQSLIRSGADLGESDKGLSDELPNARKKVAKSPKKADVAVEKDNEQGA
jgi:small subunit ribosomal protein S2